MVLAKGTLRKAQIRDLLEELKAVAERCGYWVREEKLLRDVGYRVRSGGCRLRERRLILLDREAPVQVQLDALVEILATESVPEGELSPQAARLLAQARQLPLRAAGTRS